MIMQAYFFLNIAMNIQILLWTFSKIIWKNGYFEHTKKNRLGRPPNKNGKEDDQIIQNLEIIAEKH